MVLASGSTPRAIASIVRSGPFKVALVFAGAVTITTYVLLALIYLNFASSNERLVSGIFENEILTTENTPIDQLKRQLSLRLTQDIRMLDYVGLYDADGRMTFGNVAPEIHVPLDGKAHLIYARPLNPDETGPEKALFVAVRRRDGGVLVLGRSLVYADELQASMLRGAAWALAPVVLLALLTGAIVSLRASKRLAELRDAINRVMQGDLHARLPARGTTDDIDALVRSVNQMLDEIVRLLQQIKSVGDNIAHDLRAPLAVMRARLERGLAGSSEEQLRELTSEALGDLQRAMTTVTALLRISELEGGLRRSAFDAVDLALVCRDAHELYEPLAEAKGVSLTLEAPHPVPVTGDGDLLREALANLVDNAVKFTPAGGRVAIVCGGPEALVRVADTGPGIAPGERDKIHKRFYRAQGTRHVPGVGLGLSMATTIVEMHGFGLRIGDNDPGSIFDITAAPTPTPSSSVTLPTRKAPVTA